jgi:hypothetical protein
VNGFVGRWFWLREFERRTSRALTWAKTCVSQRRDILTIDCLHLKTLAARLLCFVIVIKDYSQGIVASGVTLPTLDASCVALPTNQPIDPARNQGPLMRADNQERPFHPIYGYALITDRREGLILTDVTTFADGDPRNNRPHRALTWNPDGILNGARYLAVGGHFVYVIADAGLVILNLDRPLAPVVLSVVPLHDGRAAALQFRYLFVTDADGLQTIDITDPAHARPIAENRVALKDAQRVYVARTYAYVAAGRQGLAIVDVERPEHMRLVELYDAGGALRDARDVVVASTNASLFAYVADGDEGLKVLQLTSPSSQPKFYGFSPEPRPELIAGFATRAAALALSKGLDRDRAVDETGHQIAVFGRRGSAPFTLEEMRKLYLDADGRPWFAHRPHIDPGARPATRSDRRSGASGGASQGARRGNAALAAARGCRGVERSAQRRRAGGHGAGGVGRRISRLPGSRAGGHGDRPASDRLLGGRRGCGRNSTRSIGWSKMWTLTVRRTSLPACGRCAPRCDADVIMCGCRRCLCSLPNGKISW